MNRTSYYASLVALTLLLTAMTPCGGGERARCAECGMFVDGAPLFAAGATGTDGEALAFDSPKCLFRFLEGESGDGVRDAWVTSYYDQRRLPLDRAVYVVGSDIRSPMGEDLIPTEDADAARQLTEEHGGRIIPPDAIDAPLLRQIR